MPKYVYIVGIIHIYFFMTDILMLILLISNFHTGGAGWYDVRMNHSPQTRHRNVTSYVLINTLPYTFYIHHWSQTMETL